MRQIYFHRPKFPKISSLKNHIGDVYNSYIFSNFGPKNTKLEQSLVEICEFDGEAVTFTNATIALMVCLKALNAKKALVPSFTFAATIQALHWAGVDYDYVDIDPLTMNMDVNKLESALQSGEYDLILPVHSFGNPCDVYSISILAGIHHCKILYDAASAIASFVSQGGRHCHIGNFGDISVFSLHATKVLPAGEGGVAFFKDKKMADEVRSLTNFAFDSEKLPVSKYGTNAKMCELVAATALCGLKNLSLNQKRRLEIVGKYQDLLKGKPIRFQKSMDGSVNSYQSLCVIVDDGVDRDKALDSMAKAGIQCRKYYYPPAHKIDCFKPEKYDLKQTEKVCEKNISLPLHLYLTDDDVAYVASEFSKILEGK